MGKETGEAWVVRKGEEGGTGLGGVRVVAGDKSGSKDGEGVNKKI